MAELIDRDALLKDLRSECPESDVCISSMACIDCIVNRQPVVNSWIPFSERAPNEAGEYIVCGRWSGEKPRTWICRFEIFGDIGGFVNHAKNPPISFWRPMPEPPKKE